MLDRRGNQLFRIDELWSGHGLVIAQSLAGDPVLAVAAVIIASHHPERQGVATRKGMEERLLLDGIGLDARRIPRRNPQFTALIESHLANAASAFGHKAAMPACQTAHGIGMRCITFSAHQLRCRGHRILGQQLTQRCLFNFHGLLVVRADVSLLYYTRSFARVPGSISTSQGISLFAVQLLLLGARRRLVCK